MKARIVFLLSLLIPLAVQGGNKSAVSELNAGLAPIYEGIIADGKSSELAGKRPELALKLKYLSERHLLFSDAQIVVDKDTKYYLIKRKFSPNDIKAVLGKSNVRCKAKGRIIEVIKGARSPGMPYVAVELTSLEL